jgi:DNA-binding transcriptional ArsR family regulator
MVDSTSTGENILKALSNRTRREIVKQIAVKGSATYTEMMQVLGLDPLFESGRFSYHLKELTEVGLIERFNGDYRITDLGKNALILIDQIANESRIDRYGVLSAAIAMDPREEFKLFLNQIGFNAALILLVISSAGWFVIQPTDFIFLVSFPLIFLVSFGITCVTLVNLIRTARKFRLGLSALLFLGYDWFLIRSPNRVNYLVTSLAFLLGITSLSSGIMGVQIEGVSIFSIEISSLLLAACIGVFLAIIGLWRAERKVRYLEALDLE